MKKSRIFVAVLAAMAMGLAVFGCKSETNTEYVEKVYAEAVMFTAEDAGASGVKVTMESKTEGGGNLLHNGRNFTYRREQKVHRSLDVRN